MADNRKENEQMQVTWEQVVDITERSEANPLDLQLMQQKEKVWQTFIDIEGGAEQYFTFTKEEEDILQRNARQEAASSLIAVEENFDELDSMVDSQIIEQFDNHETWDLPVISNRRATTVLNAVCSADSRRKTYNLESVRIILNKYLKVDFERK